MTRKHEKVAGRILPFAGQGRDPHYLGFFECFNRQLFFEAHEVLEELWLAERRGPEGDFYKGLIQLAGTFVHVQKGKQRPAGALLRLAEANLAKYSLEHQGLDLREVRKTIQDWLSALQQTEADAQACLPDFPQFVPASMPRIYAP